MKFARFTDSKLERVVVSAAQLNDACLMLEREPCALWQDACARGKARLEKDMKAYVDGHRDSHIDGKPRCSKCGHTMARIGYGWECIENTCEIGLFNLGDMHSALNRRHERRREQVNQTYIEWAEAEIRSGRVGDPAHNRAVLEARQFMQDLADEE